jgi:alkanesulfonate monooxygenase SsuD/methylene tetrahydromethanopterin reductase-like flavin-dependent oxidoreductase (luciferase family)
MAQPRIGIMHQRDFAPELLRDRVRLIEDTGVDDVWVVEDAGFGGSVATAATVLGHTSSIGVGIGIMPSLARNAMYAAMELAALCRLYPGRLTAGFGHGMQDWMADLGALPQSPLQALDEVMTGVRRLLAGESVTVAGRYVNMTGVRLSFPPATPPAMLAGVRGPRSLDLAGRIADGVLLAEPSSPAYVAYARAIIDESARAAGRPRPTLATYTWLSVANRRDEARAQVRPLLASIPSGLSEPSVRGSLATLDFSARLLPIVDAATDQEALARSLDPEWIDQLSVCGNPEDCASAIERLNAAGADSVVLVPVPDGVEEQIRRVGQEVLPLLAGRTRDIVPSEQA